MEFEVERFERVAAGSGALLLRVAGRWRSATELDLGPASLLVDDGRTSHRLDALPGPDATTAEADHAGRPWRAAFAAPGDLLDGGPCAFSLHAGDAVVALPAPVPAQLAREQASLERDLAAARRENAALRLAVDELTARLEVTELGALEAQTGTDEGVEASQAEASAERARAERLEEELERARAELAALREAANVPPMAARAAPTRPLAVPSPGPVPGSLPAEWLVALVLLGIGVVVVLVVLSGAFL